MRAEKNDPGQRYDNFWDWVLADLHALWLISLAFAYIYYLLTTEEV